MNASAKKSVSPRRISTDSMFTAEERAEFHAKHGPAAGCYLAIEALFRRLKPLGPPQTDDENTTRELMVTLLHSTLNELQNSDSDEPPDYAKLFRHINEGPGALLPDLVYMINIKPKLDLADQFMGRKLFALGPIAQKIEKVLKKHESWGPAKIWDEIEKNPPKGFDFYPDKDRSIERPRGTTMNFKTFSNAVSKAKKKLKSS